MPHGAAEAGGASARPFRNHLWAGAAARLGVEDSETRLKPAHRPRRLVTALVFALLALFACWVGVHDVLFAAEVPVRVSASLLIGAGVLLVIAVAAILRWSRRAYELGILACFVGSMICLLMAGAQVLATNLNWLLAGWAALLVGCLFGVVYLRSAVPQQRRRLSVRQFPVLAPLISAGTLVSVGQFWYSAVYVPASAPPSLSLSVQLRKVGERTDTRGDRMLLAGAVTIKNTSGARVNTVSSVYRSLGIRFSPRTATASELTADLRRTVENLPSPTSPGFVARPFASEANPTVVQQGRLLPDGTYFEAGETESIPIAVLAPPSRFDVITLDVEIGVAREALHLADASSSRSSPQDEPPATVTAISDGSWLRSITRGQRWVLSQYIVTGAPPNPVPPPGVPPLARVPLGPHVGGANAAPAIIPGDAVEASGGSSSKGQADGSALTLPELGLPAISRHPDRSDSASYTNTMRRLYGLAFASSSATVTLTGKDGSGRPTASSPRRR